MEWIDITSYSRDDKERAPSWWRASLGEFTLKVGNKHIYHREEPRWLMIFDKGHETLGLRDEMTEEEAKTKALEIAQRRLQEALDAIK